MRVCLLKRPGALHKASLRLPTVRFANQFAFALARVHLQGLASADKIYVWYMHTESMFHTNFRQRPVPIRVPTAHVRNRASATHGSNRGSNNMLASQSHCNSPKMQSKLAVVVAERVAILLLQKPCEEHVQAHCRSPQTGGTTCLST